MDEEYEGIYTFIYKTVREFNAFEDYIYNKLQRNTNLNENIKNGYLIEGKYYNYWKKFSNYDEIRNRIANLSYQNAKPIIKNYRKFNEIKTYQSDAIQYIFNSFDELYNKIKYKNKSYVLINENIWRLICKDEGINEIGGMNYKIGESKITFYFNNNDQCQIKTNDNIINDTKEIYSNKNKLKNSYNNNYLNNNKGSYYKNNYNKDYNNEYLNELKKIVLLYAYERELKNKINNLTYFDKKFENYYLISKEWIEEYKQFYQFDELVNMIEHKDDLKKLLNKGFYEARKNINAILKKISFKKNISLKSQFPESLRDNNKFLSARNDFIMSNNNKLNYWKDFEIVNEDLKNLLCESELHNYAFENVSDAKGLISHGKVIIDLSKDDGNPNNYIFLIGIINNSDMLFYEEYLFSYDDENNKNDSFNYFKNDFLDFQRENLNFDVNLECELLSQEGEVQGYAVKIPPHD